MKILLALLFCLPGMVALAQEIPSTAEDRLDIALTLYNDDLALVRDRRQLQLPFGPLSLAFADVSAQIRPQTVRLYADPQLLVVSQNFAFDVISPENLLAGSVGQEIGVSRINPATGDEIHRQATLLSVTNGRAVFRLGTRIETEGPLNPWRITFDDLPEGLRERPTLVLDLETTEFGEYTLDLAYLSGGLSWQADYVATLAGGQESLELLAWATLSNTSGATYPNARVQLVAGDVQQVRQDRAAPQRVEMRAMAEPAAQEEKLFEYHLYTLERPITLADKQTKQVLFWQAETIPVDKEYRLKVPAVYYREQAEAQDLKVSAVLRFTNQQPALGRPLPGGVVRLYQRDTAGTTQFIGEDRIDHTPEGRELTLEAGRVFDITARRRQTDFNRLSREVSESAWEIEIHNAKSESVTVQVIENLPGDWEIVEESLPHTKKSAQQVRWDVPVPAEGKAVLSYRVRIR